MKIDGVRVQGGEIVLQTKDPAARRFALNFKPGEYDIKRVYQKRSLDANAYMWKLCTEIEAVTGISKIDVYKRNIREVGSYTPLPIKDGATGDFGRIWGNKGIGWFVDVIDDSKLPGYKLVFAYHGSSCYNSKDMSRLIDSVIQDAQAVGIEVITDKEKSLLIEEWGK